MDHAKLQTDEKIYFNAREYFEDLKNAIRNARRSIKIEMYIFHPGPGPGHEIMEILKLKAQENIKIQILVDGMGSFEELGTLRDFFNQLAIPFRVYNPTFWQQILFVKKVGSLLDQFFSGFGSLNARTHKKVIIIDDELCFLGSYNLAPDHLPSPKGQDWADAGISLRGRSLEMVNLLFETSWQGYLVISRAKNILRFRKIPLSNISPIRFNSSRKARYFFYRDLLSRFKNAKKSITLITPYLNPPWGFVRALTRAARRGIQVTVITGEKSDVFFYRFLPQIFHQVLTRFGITVLLYRPAVLHAKIMNIDDWYTIGSSNLNYRSFFHDQEIDAVIQSKENKKDLLIFLNKIKHLSRPFNKNILIPWYHRWVAQMFYWLRYWL